jgi:hypothetical protein
MDLASFLLDEHVCGGLGITALGISAELEADIIV